MPATAKPYGLLAEFDSLTALRQAAQQISDAGFRRWDVFTPFPMHDLDRIMKANKSPVGKFAFGGGFLGFSLGMLMIWYMNAWDYPIKVGGKPFFSPWFAFPPSYELTILFGVAGALLGLMFMARLPRLHHPLLKNARFRQVTHDRFFIVIECSDPKYVEPELRRLLQSSGCTHLEEVGG